MPSPDYLTLYARAVPDKPAVIDDRPDGTVLRWSFAELEAEANRAAPLMLERGVRRDVREAALIPCGSG